MKKLLQQTSYFFGKSIAMSFAFKARLKTIKGKMKYKRLFCNEFFFKRVTLSHGRRPLNSVSLYN